MNCCTRRNRSNTPLQALTLLNDAGFVEYAKGLADRVLKEKHDTDAARDVKVYLRPEDVLARPIAAGDANVFEGDIDKIEFLGSYCLVRVSAPAIGPQPVTVYLSLNFLAEQSLQVGSRLPLRLLPERMRLF